MYLYVDSTTNLTIGLINTDFSLVDYKYIEAKKSSLIIQSETFNILQARDLKLLEISGIIYCAGPGSYTGMRVSQGLVDICESAGIKVYSFYHFEVPRLLGIKSGGFWADAFKKEYFWTSWVDEDQTIELISSDQLEKKKENTQKVFCAHQKEARDELQTHKLIESNAKDFFKTVIESNHRVPLYYYRPLEKEFRTNNE